MTTSDKIQLPYRENYLIREKTYEKVTMQWVEQIYCSETTRLLVDTLQSIANVPTDTMHWWSATDGSWPVIQVPDHAVKICGDVMWNPLASHEQTKVLADIFNVDYCPELKRVVRNNLGLGDNYITELEVDTSHFKTQQGIANYAIVVYVSRLRPYWDSQYLDRCGKNLSKGMMWTY